MLLKKNYRCGLILLLLFSLGIACKKSKSDSPSAKHFTWTISGTTYTADSDTAFLSLRPLAIIAKKDVSDAVNNKHIEINLISFSVGEYSLDNSISGQILYKIGTGWVNSGFGKVYITENTGTTLSGNFSATLSNNAVVTGSFSGVPIKP